MFTGLCHWSKRFLSRSLITNSNVWNGAATWRTVWQCLTKLSTVVPYDPILMLQRIYPNELKTYMFTTALFIIARRWKPLCLSVVEWKNKLWFIHTVDYYSVIQREDLSSHEKTWRNLKYILLSENPWWKATYCMVSTILHSDKANL